MKLKQVTSHHGSQLSKIKKKVDEIEEIKQLLGRWMKKQGVNLEEDKIESHPPQGIASSQLHEQNGEDLRVDDLESGRIGKGFGTKLTLGLTSVR